MHITRSPVELSVFTMAIGRSMYLEMAFALARSFRLWHKANTINFFLATDSSPNNLPEDLRDLPIIPLRPTEFGLGFSPKLHLDKIAPTARSLFVDADCLCVGSLETAFQKFSGHPVSVIGNEINCGDWFGDFNLICKRFGVINAPKFNGGVYYLEKSSICTKVFEMARELEKDYDIIGFKRLRGYANDEVLISIAMALHNQKCIPEEGDIMNSLLAGPGGVEIDVFRGYSLLKNPKNHPQHNSSYILEKMKPKLVHFLGTDIHTYPYRHEIIRLQMVCEKKWPLFAATLWAFIVFSWPWKVQQMLKKILRPLYRKLFGTRVIKSTRHFS